MPRTNVIEHKSRFLSLVAVLILLPFFWLLVRTVVLVVLTLVAALLDAISPNGITLSVTLIEVIGLLVPTCIAVACSVFFYIDFHRQPITPDGRYCAACSYDLTCNTSGICPECGDTV